VREKRGKKKKGGKLSSSYVEDRQLQYCRTTWAGVYFVSQCDEYREKKEKERKEIQERKPTQKKKTQRKGKKL